MSDAVTPRCCAQARRFIRLAFRGWLDGHPDVASYMATAVSRLPEWTMLARESGDLGLQTTVAITACPFCGKGVPPLRLRTRRPKLIRVYTDGGYYCDTCARRLNECRCASPERLWEIAR